MRRSIICWLGCLLVPALISSAAAQTVTPPKLIVLIVVDQMRADYVDRFQHQWTGGLRRLLDEGAWFRQAAYPYFQTNTCVGHATISTGALPETHGIIGNNWYDRASERLRACTHDPEWRTLNYDGSVETARGPGNLLVPTLSDELRAQAETTTRVVSLSMKPRVAVMLAGQRADAALWREDFTWVTSTAYTDRRVPFVEQFLDANPIEQDRDVVWTRTLSEESYLYNGVTGASRPPEGWTGSFPHPLGGRGDTPDARFGELWEKSPWSNRYLGRLAAAAVDTLRLGQRQATDYLAIGFSALDLAGHVYGPRSHEVQDVLIQFDRTLGALLDHLDATVGDRQYLVALSADHGVMPIPEQIVTERFDAGRIPNARIVEAAEEAARAVLGPGEHVARIEEQDLYFAPGVYEELVARPDALETIMEAILAVEGIAHVFRADTIRSRRETGTSIEQALARSHSPGRSGDLLVVPRPYWTTSTNAAGHGTSYGYDTRVPILLMGPGIVAGQYLTSVTPADIAPTLAYLSQITLVHADGRVLTEALEN